MSGRRTPEQIENAAVQVAQAAESYLKEQPRPRAVVSRAEAPVLAADLAKQLRLDEKTSTEHKDAAVFVVHGHDLDALTKLEEYLSSLAITAIVLSRQDGLPPSLFQKIHVRC
jgi:predicted nucleotide-binding protein